MQTIICEEETIRRRIDNKIMSSIANGHSTVPELQAQLADVQKDRHMLGE